MDLASIRQNYPTSDVSISARRQQVADAVWKTKSVFRWIWIMTSVLAIKVKVKITNVQGCITK